ncbi:Olfactory receptor 7G1 [Heterocephalus glaber]|uniref:Olfactory receptor 7G1 n=1 Tax=Heterocephalus glaber TaxID=10181 RepID=G5ANG9_HETGA|nr:Olfactory receptor 7G1 [Heterocephalus glaber]
MKLADLEMRVDVLSSFSLGRKDKRTNRLYHELMESRKTTVSEFLLLGPTDDPEFQPLTFSRFLSIYLVTISGNLMTILAISCDSHLHTPMYLFLVTLSFNDICLSTTSVPHMLVNIRTQDQAASPRSDREFMEARNQTAVSEFILLGLTDDPELQPLIFSLFLSIYLVTVLGNLLMILAISSDSHLHTPMYNFLSNLSLNDICLSTTTVPKMLVNIQAQDQSITHTGCLAQICLVLVFGAFESCLLALMAYDRYMAICHPVGYAVILSTCMCILLTLSSFFISIIDGLLHSLMIRRLAFCAEL